MPKKENSAAEEGIIRAWDAWAVNAGDKLTGRDGMVFFNYLRAEKPELLNFRYSGSDKWQCIHAWLLNAKRVSD